MSNRKAFASGRFFPSDRAELLSTLSNLIDLNIPKHIVYGAMVPHATFTNSGRLTASLFSSIEIPNTVIIMCPNHTYKGEPVAVWGEGCFETPLGDVSVNSELVKLILNQTQLVKIDETPHIEEHAIEVQLPFLKYLNPNVTIVPITVRNLVRSEYHEIGYALASAIKQYANEVLIVASSDMTHYEDSKIAETKDRNALAYIENLDMEGLQDSLTRNRCTMCGDAGVSIMLEATKELGAKKGITKQYASSGDVDGNYSSVVGYATCEII